MNGRALAYCGEFERIKLIPSDKFSYELAIIPNYLTVSMDS